MKLKANWDSEIEGTTEKAIEEAMKKIIAKNPDINGVALRKAVTEAITKAAQDKATGTGVARQKNLLVTALGGNEVDVLAVTKLA